MHEGGYSIRKVRSNQGLEFQFVDRNNRVVPPTEDLARGDWQSLVTDVSAETPGLHAASHVPDLDWRPPDYDHIAWWMVNFMGRRAVSARKQGSPAGGRSVGGLELDHHHPVGHDRVLAVEHGEALVGGPPGEQIAVER